VLERFRSSAIDARASCSNTPTPIADWIEQQMHPVEANRPAFADSTCTKAHYYRLENSFIYLEKEDADETVRGPLKVNSRIRLPAPRLNFFV
jgi:hypothetical protein